MTKLIKKLKYSLLCVLCVCSRVQTMRGYHEEGSEPESKHKEPLYGFSSELYRKRDLKAALIGSKSEELERKLEKMQKECRDKISEHLKDQKFPAEFESLVNKLFLETIIFEQKDEIKKLRWSFQCKINQLKQTFLERTFNLITAFDQKIQEIDLNSVTEQMEQLESKIIEQVRRLKSSWTQVEIDLDAQCTQTDQFINGKLTEIRLDLLSDPSTILAVKEKTAAAIKKFEEERKGREKKWQSILDQVSAGVPSTPTPGSASTPTPEQEINSGDPFHIKEICMAAVVAAGVSYFIYWFISGEDYKKADAEDDKIDENPADVKEMEIEQEAATEVQTLKVEGELGDPDIDDEASPASESVSEVIASKSKAEGLNEESSSIE